MGRAGRSGGRSSSSSRSNFSGGRSRGGSSFSGGWSSGPRKSRSSSSSSKTSTKSSSSSSNNFSGGWSNGNSSSSRSSQRSSIDKPRSSYNSTSRRTYKTLIGMCNDEVGRSFNGNQTVYENSTFPKNPRVTKNSNPNGKSSMGIGCILILIVLILGIVLSNSNMSSDGDLQSTVERTPLESSKVILTETYYYDDLGWINDTDTLFEGLDIFYSQTGVQPVLIITDNIDGNYMPNDQEAEIFMTSLYDYWFEDEGHMLVLFLEVNDDHAIWIYCGDDAAKVVDEEARKILYSNIEYEYYSDKTDEQMFSDAFADTGSQIMGVNKNFYLPMVLIIVIVFVVVVIKDNIRNKNSSSLEVSRIPTDVMDEPKGMVENHSKDNSVEEVVVECSGCGAKNKLKVGQVSACEYCDTPIKG